ncbi:MULTISPECIES: TIGR03943 family protein [Thermocrispum]|jgi:uncharacterized repeat protein (TIGR03943 family)|uniref:TIGR03943 family putative permease subunit n=1 Tax=Thermocrispum TaxID=37924 RepID=UPI00041D2A29|nr:MULTISPECIES: TIGR03943 family protein [Thermocrispum]
MRRETANVLLLLLGGCLLKLAWTGDYLRYVKPQHRWWLVGAGLVVVVLAAVAIWRDMRAARPAGGGGGGAGAVGSARMEGDGHSGAPAGADHHARADSSVDDHGHAHGGGRSAWLLLAPVLAGLLVAPPALGADSVSRSLEAGGRQVDPAQVEAFSALPADEVTTLPLSQFHARAVWGEGKTLIDRRVRLSGFVVRERGRTYIARVVIRCCAADGYPVPVRLVGDSEMLRGLGQDEWIEVVGRYRPPSRPSSVTTPDLTVEELRRIPEPADPYEY